MGAIHGRGYYDRIGLGEACFQVHGVDAEGATILRKQLWRAQVLAFFSRLRPCLVGLEACATAHYWARELRALGHEVRLMPAQYVEQPVRNLEAEGLSSLEVDYQLIFRRLLHVSGTDREP